ncbi:hypothetical protein ACIRPO_30620 [Streptomyces bacillaris]|uniref:hypothetical protein n=1 Tax=Streptomyces bacillaris TaxID=68179 RepID=UPI0037FA53A8
MRPATGQVAVQRRRAAIRLATVVTVLAVVFAGVVLWRSAGEGDRASDRPPAANRTPDSSASTPEPEETVAELCRTRSPGGPTAPPPRKVTVTAAYPEDAPLSRTTDISWVSYALDGSRLLTAAGRTGTVTVWDTGTGRRITELTGGRPGGGLLSPDGTHLAAHLGSAGKPTDSATAAPLAVWDVRRGGAPVCLCGTIERALNLAAPTGIQALCETLDLEDVTFTIGQFQYGVHPAVTTLAVHTAKAGVHHAEQGRHPVLERHPILGKFLPSVNVASCSKCAALTGQLAGECAHRPQTGSYDGQAPPGGYALLAL